MPRLTELDYTPDSARRFQVLRALPCAVFLDSGHPAGWSGRYDILAADPYILLTTRGPATEIRHRDRVEWSGEDPLELLRRCLGERVEPHQTLPFTGGAIGYFGYDLGRRYERVKRTAVDDIGMPEMVVGLYDWAVIVDHENRQCWLAGQGRDPGTFASWGRLVRIARGEPPHTRVAPFERVRLSESGAALTYGGPVEPRLPFEVLSDVQSNLDEARYAAAFATVKDHIRQGNCYQVNLTQRFEATVRGDTWDAYLALRKANPAPFSAFLDLPEGQILSSSPERFLRVTNRSVETKPIKGTRPRSTDEIADRRLASELRMSEKDRAENVMIVDLLRNDLGRCCLPGSVRADRLFEIESFASVHHLVSTVTGTLDPQLHAVDLLRACFPGGSITGAPKLAAMQIIDDVEPHRRGVYCGSIGHIGFDGDMDTNIAIRTLVRQADTVYAWAGGGIVADSMLEAEYQESFDKAAALLSVLTRSRVAAAG